MDWVTQSTLSHIKLRSFTKWMFSRSNKNFFFFNLGGDFYGKVQSQEELSKKNTLLGSIYDLQVREASTKNITYVTGSRWKPAFDRNLVFFSVDHICGEKFWYYCRV